MVYCQQVYSSLKENLINLMSDENWNMWSEEGDWGIDLEEHPELEPYKEEIRRVVNDNVEHGCCGGCI